jgi:hypothetical protein
MSSINVVHEFDNNASELHATSQMVRLWHFQLRRPRFNPREVPVGFVVGRVALWQIFSKYFSFPLPITSSSEVRPIDPFVATTPGDPVSLRRTNSPAETQTRNLLQKSRVLQLYQRV